MFSLPGLKLATDLVLVNIGFEENPHNRSPKSEGMKIK